MTPRRITTRARRLLDVPVWPFAWMAAGFLICWALPHLINFLTS